LESKLAKHFLSLSRFVLNYHYVFFCFSANRSFMTATHSARFAGLNSTAYRVFKLLQWLTVAPLTFKQINQRFQAETKIKQSISQDTVWLYLNTLKLLGCELSRPSASNQFTYQLISHPFGLPLNSETLEVLALLKQELEDVLSYKQQLTLDQLAKALINISNTSDKNQDRCRYFETAHSVDYAPFEDTIATLEEAIEQELLLKLLYSSPVKGDSLLEVLPQELYYNNGTLLLLACREGFEEASQLRVDRIIRVDKREATPPDNEAEPAWAKTCREKRQTEPSIKLQVICPSLNAWLPLAKQEEVKLLEAKPHACLLEVTLNTHNEFALIQRLLQLPFPFEVLSPESLKQKLQQQLTPMHHYYKKALSAWGNEGDALPAHAKNKRSTPYNNKGLSASLSFTGLEAFNYE
jgi:predicted DNA-binding transcriptional regulator YafY